MSDDLTALRLQLDWGADEALGDVPIDRFADAAVPLARAAPAPRLQAATLAPIRAVPQAETLVALMAEIEAFGGCRLRDTATTTVRPDGNLQARIVLVADAPGSEDDRSGRAFSGATGEMLDRVMASAGFNRTSVLLATIVPWRPPGGRPPTEAEVQSCLPFMHRLLAIVQPRHLILVGGAAVKALTGRAEPVRRLRGNWIEAAIPQVASTISVLPVPAIDQWLASPSSKQLLWSDLISLHKAATTT